MNQTSVHRPASEAAPAPYTPGRASPVTSTRLASPTRASSRPLSPSRTSTRAGRVSPARASNRPLSPSRASEGLSPDVTAISQRIFDNIDEIRRDIQLTSDDPRNSTALPTRYKYHAERDVPSSRDSSPNKRRRDLSPANLVLITEDSPSVRAFRNDLAKTGWRHPRPETSGIISESPTRKFDLNESMKNSTPKLTKSAPICTVFSTSTNDLALKGKEDNISGIL